MDRNKSLGSSPIGFSSPDSCSYDYIRDLGVASDSSSSNSNLHSSSSIRDEAHSEPERSESYRGRVSTIGFEGNSEGSSRSADNGDKSNKSNRADKKPGKEQSDKKIVSYYLDLELIQRLKDLADAEGSYYSSVVSQAIEAWVERKGY